MWHPTNANFKPKVQNVLMLRSVYGVYRNEYHNKVDKNHAGFGSWSIWMEI